MKDIYIETGAIFTLPRPYQRVQIISCTAEHIYFSWYRNLVENKTLMPLAQWSEMNPVKDYPSYLFFKLQPLIIPQSFFIFFEFVLNVAPITKAEREARSSGESQVSKEI